MGNVSSSLEEQPILFIKKPDRFNISEIIVSNHNNDPYISFPVASNYISAIPNTIDLIEFLQDPNSKAVDPNKLLLKLIKGEDMELKLKFRFNIGGSDEKKSGIKGLTFINVASEKELARILTVEFNDDPNLHKHPNVTLIGDYGPDGSKPSDNEWTWKWSPPHNMDEIHRGWRNHCCFAEYDKKNHSFQLLASFTFWVAGKSPSITSGGAGSCRQSSEDLTYECEPEDGPLFRATLTAFEKKTVSLKHHIKRILKAAIASHEVLIGSQGADQELLDALRDAAVSHPQAFQPVLDSFLEEAYKKISLYRENVANQMTMLLIEPLRKLYENDIKVADSKKKDFEEESRDYYQFLSKYLSIKVDSAKEKKKLESDTKYQSKRRNFELKKFDYYAYMQDLHCGRKDQEILYHLINFAEKQFTFYQLTATGILDMKPGLDKLSIDVAEAAKENHLMRKEREERRRALEIRMSPNSTSTVENLNENDLSNNSYNNNIGGGGNITDNTNDNTDNVTMNQIGSLVHAANRFKGIRDLEHHDTESASSVGRKKEGFLFATSRATQHGTTDPIAKNTWHNNWRKQLETHNEPINLRFATVREARGIDRRFCFEVITPQFRRIYQAMSDDDMSSWVTVISNAIESLLNGTSSCRNLDNRILTSDTGDPGAVTLFNNTKSVKRRGTLPSLSDKRKNDMKKNHVAVSSISEESKRPTQLNGQARKNSIFNKNSTKILEEIIGSDASNVYCADCDSQCSGIHRSLGTHVSKIRSLTLDTTSYTPDLVQLIKSIGNARSNAIWEANLLHSDEETDLPPIPPSKDDAPPPVPPKDHIPSKVQNSDWDDLINLITPTPASTSSTATTTSLIITPSSPPSSPSIGSKKKMVKMKKPSSTDSRDIKQKFITLKYVDKAFVDFSLVDEDKTATDILFEAVKMNDVPQAMQAIALKADLNATRRFEVADDHGLKSPVILALLHIEPSRMIFEGGRPLFQMAELLLQNGASLDNVLSDNLVEILGVASQPITRSSAKSVGTWTKDIVNDIKKSGKTVYDVVQSSGNNAAIRYLTPKMLARGTLNPTINSISNNNNNSISNSNSIITTTSTGGLAGGQIPEKKLSTSNIGRSISVTVKNVLS
ncbi:14520_t:CDS:2 [Entrophospora sp. SA101]|nr:14520_t:CDS:2 [Entrophospora sp. SA101]